MPLIIKNTRDLIDPKTLKLKILLVSPAGFGKTEFISGIPNVLVGACETGHGGGLMGVATKNIDYVRLDSYDAFDEFCSGKVGEANRPLALDSLSDMCNTFIKDKALTNARKGGDSDKRKMGQPELDDYGTMGELARKLVRKLLDLDRHILCTASIRVKTPGEGEIGGETFIGPNLPGAFFLGSTGMFDVVLMGRSREAFDNPAKPDASKKHTERYWLTAGKGMYLAKNRLSVGNGSFLPQELIYDLNTGSGTFNDILSRAVTAYTEHFQKVKDAALNGLAVNAGANRSAPVTVEKRY